MTRQILPGGRLGDLFGHRRLFLLGIAPFTAASPACGLANTQALLIAARAVQGLGGTVNSAFMTGGALGLAVLDGALLHPAAPPAARCRDGASVKRNHTEKRPWSASADQGLAVKPRAARREEYLLLRHNDHGVAGRALGAGGTSGAG